MIFASFSMFHEYFGGRLKEGKPDPAVQGSSIQKFLFLSLPEFVPFLCNHIAFFHIEGQKEIYAQVGQIMS